MEWTRKQVSERLGMPARQIQFYSEARLLPDLKQLTGKGRARKYSKRDIIALMVIDELFNGYGITLARLEAIMSTWTSAYHEWWLEQHTKTITKGYLVIYADRSSEKEGVAVKFLPKWTAKAINWQGYQSAVVLDIGALVQRVGL